MDEQAMRDRLAAAPVGRLATASADARPHVVPFCFALDGDTIYSAVDQKPKSTTRLRRLRNIGENPAVEVVVDSYDDDWTRLWWVRASGRARIVDDPAEHRRALDLLSAKYAQYAADPPRGPVFAIAVTSLRGWRHGEGG